jgi:anaerobic magnesium-protoporphyrin IX monomethyl ester cyclase
VRVLLINPFYPISETPSPPLGLAYLAGALERAGCTVRIMDCVVFPYSDQWLNDLMIDFGPHLVGATAVTMTVDHAVRVLDQAKAIDPAVTTVLGGPHATFCARELLDGNARLDVVACGEGETTVVELAAAIGERRPLEAVPGIVFRRGGRLVETPRPPLVDLNRLAPPARHRIPLGRYRALGLPVSMTTSRGCPFRCIFCVGRKMVGARVRYRHPVGVVDEMEALSRLEFHQINLADDLFTANRNHCLAVCDEIMRRGLSITWTSFARVDTVSRDVLAAMFRAGCTTLSFGVESGSPEMLERIRKGITCDQVVAAARLCLDVGISPHASFILGLPGETRRSLDETLAFGERLKSMGVNHGFHILAPFPGTDIRDRLADYDLEILSDDWTAYHANRAVVRTAGIAPETMDAIVIDAEKRFDQWLADIDRRRRAGTADAHAAWPLVRLEHTVVLYDMLMQRLIEIMPAHPATGADADREALTRHVTPALDHPPERIRAAVDFAVQTDHLVRSVKDGHAEWTWRDYL